MIEEKGESTTEFAGVALFAERHLEVLVISLPFEARQNFTS